MTLLKVAFHTLGCKLNQLETESLADTFRGSGAAIVPFAQSADLYVVNTCTVTGKAEQKARRLIRQAMGAHANAVILVTGCYAQMDAPALAALGGRIVVVPGDEKQTIPALAAHLADSWQGHGDLLDAVLEWRHGAGPGTAPIPIAGQAPPADRFIYRPETFTYHSRPSLKIQDGCDNRCSYCRVCLARGPSVSIDPAEALRRIRLLEDAGRAEVVLTGVNLSQYRGQVGAVDGECDDTRDRVREDGRILRFGSFLSYILANTSRIALRISSFEPDRIDDEFLAVFADPRVRPHVHLAMQSGSDTVLRRMRRTCDSAGILGAVSKLRSVRDDPFIAADIIAGFSGETEAEFTRTLEVCRECDLAWIHAFPFSPRPGTPAFDMKPMVPERIAGERVRALTALSESRHAAYIQRWAGRTVDVILEGSDTDTGPDVQRTGTSDNYLKLRISGVPRSLKAGQSIRATITGIAGSSGSGEHDGFVSTTSAVYCK